MTEDRSVWAIGAIGAALVALFIAAGVTGAAGNGIPTELWAAGGALGGALVGVLVPPPVASRHAAAGAAVINTAAVNAALSRATDIAAAATASGNDGDRSQTLEAQEALSAVLAASQTPVAKRSATAAISEAIQSHQTLAQGMSNDSVQAAAAQAASAAAPAAAAAANARDILGTALDGGKIIVPALIALLAFYIGIRMSDGSVHFSGCPVTQILKTGQTEPPCAGALFQTARAMVTLGAAAAGGLVGLFAPTPSK